MVEKSMSARTGDGRLVPLKTAQEVRARDTLVEFYLTRVPKRLANGTLKYLYIFLPIPA